MTAMLIKTSTVYRLSNFEFYSASKLTTDKPVRVFIMSIKAEV